MAVAQFLKRAVCSGIAGCGIALLSAALIALGAGEAAAQRGGGGHSGGGMMGGGAGHMPMAVMGPSSRSFGRNIATVPGARGYGPGGRGPVGIGHRRGGARQGYIEGGGCESGRAGRGCRPPIYRDNGPAYRDGRPIYSNVPRPVVYGAPGFRRPIDDDAPVPAVRTRRASVGPVNQSPARTTSAATTRRGDAGPALWRNGMPPADETRFVPDQIVCLLRADITERGIDRFLRDNGLARTDNGARRLPLLSARVFRYRITDGRPVRSVIATVQRDRRVIAVQPNYLYEFAQSDADPQPAPDARSAAPAASEATPASSTAASAPPASQASQQYVVGKLHLARAHQIARGERVLVAVIDSGIDASHPELAGAVVKTIDVAEDGSAEPHAHGTAMAGAIAAKAQLTGVAPAAQVIAVRAFSAGARGASSTSYQLASAVDHAVAEGARVINLSFAGPADPLVSEALKRARAKNVVLVAAAGNAGPNSPPLYPAADPSVIAVTATDENDKVFAGANRGKHIAVAAPGVDVLVPEPRGNYGLSTGTSVAAAHISGVAALILARNPALDPEGVKQILRRSAHALAATPAEDAGAGLVDAFGAISAADQRTPPAGAAAGGRRR